MKLHGLIFKSLPILMMSYSASAAYLHASSAADSADGNADGIINIANIYSKNSSGAYDFNGGSQGIYAGDSYGGTHWRVVTDADINSSSNSTGILVDSNGKLSIESSLPGKTIYIQNSRPNSITARNGASLLIKGMNIDAGNTGTSSNYSIWADNNAKITLEGSMNEQNYVRISNNVGSSSMRAIWASASGVIEIKYMDVFTENNSGGSNWNTAGISAEYNGKVRITGKNDGSNKIVANNNTSSVHLGVGISSTSAHDLVIKNMSIEANGNGYGLYGALDISGIESSNYLIVSNNTAAGMNTANRHMRIKNMDISGENNIIAISRQGGTFELRDSSLTAVNDWALASFDEKNDAYKLGNFVFENADIKSEVNNLLKVGSGYKAVINADNTRLSGRVEMAGVSQSDISLNNKSLWNMKEDSDVTKLNVVDSTVDLSGSSYNNLTVNNFYGDNAVLKMRTYFDGDGNNTDKLIIKASALGNTYLDIIYAGSNNEQSTGNGIMVVDATTPGAVTDIDAFSLINGVVDTSAFQYELFKGDKDGLGESWYLRSNGRMSSVAETIAQEPSLVISMARAGMNSLNKRMGELRDTSPTDKNGLWVRTYGQSMNVKDFIDSDLNVFGVEFGFDQKLDLDERVYLGIVAGISTAEKIRTHQEGSGKNGAGNGNAKSLGVYATWLGDNGWFIDGVFRTFWENFNMTSYSSNNLPITYNPNRQINVVSLEAGKQIEWLLNKYDRVFIEPKIEFMYGWADAKSFKTNLGQVMRFGETQTLNTKFAVAAGYNTTLSNCIVLEPYVQIAAIEEWKGRTNIKFAEAEYKSNVSGFSMEYLIGLNARLNKSLSIYSDFAYEKGSVVESLSGNLGIRYSF